MAQQRKKEDTELYAIGLRQSKKKSAQLNQVCQTIQTYRDLADAQTQKNRLASDKIRIKERLLEKQAAVLLLNQERDLTNHNLQRERTKTDRYFKIDAFYLSKEQKAGLVSKKALVARDEFLAIVSHDLRNALGAIQLSAETILEDKLGPSDKEELQELADIIKRHSSNLIRMTTVLSDGQKISAGGEIELTMVPYDIVQLARDSIAAFSIVAAEKNLRLNFECSYPSLTILCDDRRINQVFFNLLSNAIKFTPAEGVITLKLESFNGSVRISVHDTGPGIPIEQRKRIFDRYFQIQGRSKQGLGLGLFISKWIIEAHGGKIGIDSPPHSGSTFFFTLPKEQKAQSSVQVAH